jgi:hypothetical protein
MKYKIRKRENITMYEASEVVELDDKHFRKLEENPYTGDSEEEFLKYISDLRLYSGDTPEGLKDSVVEELLKLGENANMEAFGSSAEKFANVWFESGEIGQSKYGGFVINHSTHE